MSDDFQQPYEYEEPAEQAPIEPQQPYQQPYQQAPYAPAPEPKKKMNGWIIALIVVLVIVVVCCLCLCLSMVVLGPAMGNVFSDIVETLEVPAY